MRTGIMAFCATERDIRQYLQTPWKKDGKVYATNGHILIETTAEFAPGDWPDYEHGRRPKNIETMFFDAEARTTIYSALPDIPPVTLCSTCDGAGRTEWYWEEDEDGNNYKARDGRMHICDDCDGYGEGFHRVAVADTGFQARYLRLLATLPGIEIAPHGTAPCLFRFSAGRGLLMPCRER